MEKTIQLIKDYYGNFNAGRFANMLEMLSEDVVHDINQGERQKGKAAFKAFLDMMDHVYSEQLTDMVITANPEGDRASAEFICNGTYKVSVEGLPEAKGQKYSLPVGAFFEVKGGKITRVTNYYNLQDWISQVNR